MSNIVCPYSPDCFTCPLPDCKIGQDVAKRVNKLPWDVGGMRVDNGNKKKKGKVDNED